MSIQTLSSTAEVSELLSKYDIFLCDCDGVLWHGNHLVPGVKDAVARLHKLGKKIVYVTNNSTKSRAQYLEKFVSLGLPASKEEIFSSSFAAASYLKSIRFQKRVYVVGEIGIREELNLVNIHSIGAEDDRIPCTAAEAAHIKIDKEVGAVVVGLDTNINYKKCAIAQGCLLENEGCIFVATNTDSSFPSARILPGAGAMVAMIKTCTGKEPVVLGKPETTLLDIIIKEYNIREKSRVLMVGDRLDTDILFGINGGIDSLMVLTGISSLKEAKEGNIRPTYVIDSFGLLAKE